MNFPVTTGEGCWLGQQGGSNSSSFVRLTLFRTLKAHVEFLPIKRGYQYPSDDQYLYWGETFGHTLHWLSASGVSGKRPGVLTVIVDQSHLVITHQPMRMYQHESFQSSDILFIPCPRARFTKVERVLMCRVRGGVRTSCQRSASDQVWAHQIFDCVLHDL